MARRLAGVEQVRPLPAAVRQLPQHLPLGTKRIPAGADKEPSLEVAGVGFDDRGWIDGLVPGAPWRLIAGDRGRSSRCGPGALAGSLVGLELLLPFVEMSR